MQDHGVTITGNALNDVRIIGTATSVLLIAVVIIGMEWEAKVIGCKTNFLYERWFEEKMYLFEDCFMEYTCSLLIILKTKVNWNWDSILRLPFCEFYILHFFLIFK